MIKPIDSVAGKITTKISMQKNDYVNHRIVENALKLGDTFSNSKKAKYLCKVADKASTDWVKSNKAKNFIMNNSKKLVKTAGIVGVIAVAVGGIFGSIVSHTIGKKAVA